MQIVEVKNENGVC